MAQFVQCPGLLSLDSSDVTLRTGLDLLKNVNSPSRIIAESALVSSPNNANHKAGGASTRVATSTRSQHLSLVESDRTRPLRKALLQEIWRTASLAHVFYLCGVSKRSMSFVQEVITEFETPADFYAIPRNFRMFPFEERNHYQSKMKASICPPAVAFHYNKKVHAVVDMGLRAGMITMPAAMRMKEMLEEARRCPGFTQDLVGRPIPLLYKLGAKIATVYLMTWYKI